jgi:hypothetical protein
LSAAIRRSQLAASEAPAPMHGPMMTAMVGRAMASINWQVSSTRSS